MKYILSMNNEQIVYLYNFLSQLKFDRVKNRERRKFLQTIEDSVLDFEKKRMEMADNINLIKDPAEKVKAAQVVNKDFENMKKEVKEYTFADREAFSQMQSVITTTTEQLSGNDGKLFTEIEDVFTNAKKIEE